MEEDYASGLSFIELTSDDPFVLYNDWKKQAQENGCSEMNLSSMCLATLSKNDKVGNRTVILNELTKDQGFAFSTTTQGRKVQEMIDHPNVAATFLWIYEKEGKTFLTQVRIEGTAIQSDIQATQRYYDAEPFFCKIRAHVCDQGQEVDWNELKKAHDELVKDVKEHKKELPMPAHYIAFEIVPSRFEFYYGFDYYIADRVVFTKDGNEWKHTRVGT